VLEARRAPAPISAPAARIAAAALRDPRYDLSMELAERERIRTALTAAGFDAPPTAGNFVWIRTDSDVAGQLETMGIIVRRFAEGLRVTIRRPSENDVFLRALGAEPGPVPGRETTVIRTSTETALRITLSLDGSGRSHVLTGIGFLDHLLTLLAFHAGFDLDCVAGGDLDVDEHHTVEDVLAALGTALQQALGAREGVARYGSAVVPMDEARATAAVDLVRRAHAEITLGFTGDRVGGLALFGLSLAKLFLYDLSRLSSISRALSFLAVGAVLLLGGFFYQRLGGRAEDGTAASA
jgi:imidazoleglycerol phosphate dehydratase HisB